MSILLKDFEKFIKERRLFSHAEGLVVGVSGGVDSVVLTHLLTSLGYEVILAHCNFQLRGEESDKDEAFVQDLARTLKVRFEIIRFDTKSYMAEEKLSLQMAARTLRYDWFDTLKRKYNTDKLLTAHHLDDSIETTIYNFAKGAGPNGMKGIESISDFAVRPLIRFSKEDILAYATAHDLKWRQDQSNFDNKYQRNLIRNSILPDFKKINPGLQGTLERSQRKFLGYHQLLQLELERFRGQWCEEKVEGSYIKKQGFDHYQYENKLILLEELLKPYGFNYTQVENCFQSWNEVGASFYSDSHRLNIDREFLLLTGSTIEINASYAFPGIGEYHYAERSWSLHQESFENQDFSLDPNIAMLDAKKVVFPLTLRPWQQGDKFVPLGMRNKKKLSDFMIDIKIPLNLKRTVMVIEDANQSIVWVVGYRIDNRFKIDSHTSEVLYIKSIIQ